MKALSISTFNPFQIERLLNKLVLKHNPVTNQFNYHSDLFPDKLILSSHSIGIICIAYVPWTLQIDIWKISCQVLSFLIQFSMQRNMIVIPVSVTPARLQENFQVSWKSRLPLSDSTEPGGPSCFLRQYICKKILTMQCTEDEPFELMNVSMNIYLLYLKLTY